MKIILVLAISGVVSGCGYTARQVAEPSSITLDAALGDVADSLNNLHQRTQNREKLGMAVDEVSVTFQISAKGASTTTAGASAAGVPLGAVGGTGGLSISNTLANEGNRGNTIVVKFKNLATADLSKGSLALTNKKGVLLIDPRCLKPNPPKELRCPPIEFSKAPN
ncbi:hypothetical protein [Mesorhizobium sp. M0019]|uniref:hypothetical protein n=1 Tax=Mesorhizobium sp. M0019 TaxID=2956845 RepID=UPI0033365E9E